MKKHNRKRKMHYKHPRHYVKNGDKQPEIVTEIHPSPQQPVWNPPRKADPWAHRSAGLLCQTCMWFALKAGEVGRCRRRAPSPDGALGWPVVFKADWCGQHKLDETKID